MSNTYTQFTAHAMAFITFHVLLKKVFDHCFPSAVSPPLVLFLLCVIIFGALQDRLSWQQDGRVGFDPLPMQVQDITTFSASLPLTQIYTCLCILQSFLACSYKNSWFHHIFSSTSVFFMASSSPSGRLSRFVAKCWYFPFSKRSVD